MRRIVFTALSVLISAIALPAAAFGADWRKAPVVPKIGGALERSLQKELDADVEAGARVDTFAKVGDSITESGSFLQGIGCGEERLGSHRELKSTIGYFGGRTFPDDSTGVYCGRSDSFSRASAAALTSQRASWALDPGAAVNDDCRRGESPLRCEYRLTSPAFAMVMFGTNDSSGLGTKAFIADMQRIVDESRELNVIPVLTTLPPRLDDRRANRRIPSYNAALRKLAADERLPLINFWRALDGKRMVDGGMDPDGIHPNVFKGSEAVRFDGAGLRYGYNQRNLITLQTLDVLRRKLLR